MTRPKRLAATRRVVLALAILALGCDDTDSTPAPTAATAWPDAPAGFAPMVLPPAADDCDGTTVWIGERAVERVEARGAELPAGEPDVSDLPAGVAREVARVVRPANVLAVMVGAYNGPGGEPLFRWRMRQGPRIVLLFDRRISRARFDAALRGAVNELGWPVRVGGVGEAGERRCAAVFVGVPEDTLRQGATAIWQARVADDGALTVEGAHAGTLAPGGAAPLPGEEASGAHVLAIGAAETVPPTAIVRGIATARWTDHRYGWVPPAR